MRITDTQQGVLWKAVSICKLQTKCWKRQPHASGCSIIQCALPPLPKHDQWSDVVNALQDILENCTRCLLSATREQGQANIAGLGQVFNPHQVLLLIHVHLQHQSLDSSLQAHGGDCTAYMQRSICCCFNLSQQTDLMGDCLSVLYSVSMHYRGFASYQFAG